jgi:hypothetical protein
MVLSPKFSPKTKRMVLSGNHGAAVRSLVELSPAANEAAMASRLEELGATIRSWMDSSHVLSLDIPVERLADVANMKDVIYINTDDRMSR